MCVGGGHQAREEHRNTGGEQNTGNTGEQEVEIDNKTQDSGNLGGW